MSTGYSLRRRSSNMANSGEIRKKSAQMKVADFSTNTTVHLPEETDDDDIEDIVAEGWKRFLKPLLFIVVFIIIATIAIIFFQPKSDLVCYVRVGCFSVASPWTERPSLFNFFPQSPSVINTTFIVTSRQDRKGLHGIVTLPNFGHFGIVNDAHIPWNKSSVIVFLTHGYTDLSGTWMQTLKDAFLAQGENVIVVLVDWESGAAGYYPQVVSNTRVVAREITLFIRYIQRKFGRTSPKRIHLVGHSLGSQISSYVGKSFVNSSYEIHQITALDPAYPLFDGYCPEIRLHKSDARHVLAIHSNIGPWGLGMKDPVGTVDIYLNDGRDQRGCPRLGSILKDVDNEQEPTQMKVDNSSLPKILDKLSDLKDLLACSHRRAYEWLEDVLRDQAGTLYAYKSHTTGSTPVVAYPIEWINETNIVTLAKNRAIQFSFCQEHGKNRCWKLEKSEKDAFFRLPSLHPNESSSYIIPTTDRSPFCTRFARLELSTCPSLFSQNNPIFGGNSAMIQAENMTLTLSQVAFDEEIKIYTGLLHDSPKLKGWVEFACDQLHQPVRIEDDYQDDPYQNGRNENYLSVKLQFSLDVSGSPRNEQPKISDSSSSKRNDTKAWNPKVCVDKMKLAYYDEAEKDIVRLNWLLDRVNGANGGEGKMMISTNECVEILFRF